MTAIPVTPRMLVAYPKLPKKANVRAIGFGVDPPAGGIGSPQFLFPIPTFKILFDTTQEQDRR